MTFSQDNFLERGQGGGSQKPEDGIFSNNFGGLNKVASSLNVPFEDSPDLLNVDVDVAGNINKRKGTKIVNWNLNPGLVSGVSSIPFTSGLGYNFVVLKNASALSLLEVINDVATTVINKTNVFTDEASDIRLNYVATSEVEPRLIITTGVCPIVQLKFIEQQQVFTGTAATNVVIQNANRFINANAASVVFFKDRVRVPGVTVAYNAGLNQLTVSNIPAFTGTFTFDILLVAWQWWAESYYFLGDRFSGTSNRTNSPATIDKVVAIPSSLRDNADLMSPVRPQQYPIIAYRSTNFFSEYTPAYPGNPATRIEYTHCDGVPYNGTGIATPSPLFITFGGTADGNACVSNEPQAGGALVACPSSMPVVFQRRRKINFNGGRGWNNSNIKVYVDSALVQLSTSFTTPVTGYGTAFHSYSEDLSVIVGSPNSNTYGVGFTASAQVGLASNASVEIVNPMPQFLGSGANSNRGDLGASLNADGTWISAFGFGDFCDYGAGSFPTNVALYQGRLVFSGFLNNSLRVLFSNQYDSVIPGNNFSHYQIDSVATLATDAFDASLSSSPDDVTKALVEWQQSLFVLTRKSVYRITGGNNAAITALNKIIVLISNIGLINSYSVCRTDKSILYLSDTGVFDLSTSAESTEYVAGDKSLKIRPLIGIASQAAYESLSWLAFDSNNKLVYFAYPEKNILLTAYRLFVYNTFRESWTEYYTAGGFNSYQGLSYIDRAKGSNFGLFLNTRRNVLTGAAQDLMFVRTGYEKYIDYAQKFIGTGATQTISAPTNQLYETVTKNKVQEYAYDRPETKYAYGVRCMPLTDIKDVVVYLETAPSSNAYATLVFGTDYIKTPNGKIFLLANPGTGKRLYIEGAMPVNKGAGGINLYPNATVNYPLVLFKDNKLQRLYTNFYNYDGLNISAAHTLNAVMELGQTYPTYYHSPVFTKERLSNMKRSKYIYALFDNKLGQPTFNAVDVNTASGQIDYELVGTPKQRLNANISIKYEDDDYSDTSYDNYGFEDLIWDTALFDINAPTAQYRHSVLFKQALQGVGYSYQMVIWSYDETSFTLAGYQIVANVRGSRFINRSK